MSVRAARLGAVVVRRSRCGGRPEALAASGRSAGQRRPGSRGSPSARQASESGVCDDLRRSAGAGCGESSSCFGGASGARWPEPLEAGSGRSSATSFTRVTSRRNRDGSSLRRRLSRPLRRALALPSPAAGLSNPDWRARASSSRTAASIPRSWGASTAPRGTDTSGVTPPTPGIGRPVGGRGRPPGKRPPGKRPPGGMSTPPGKGSTAGCPRRRRGGGRSRG